VGRFAGRVRDVTNAASLAAHASASAVEAATDGGRGEHELSRGAEEVRDVGAGRRQDEGCGMCGLGRVRGAGCTTHGPAT
jgi:hypothetical protein